MDCEQAKHLIDQRVQEGVDQTLTGQPDRPELDSHLSECPRCSALLRELQRTRQLLQDAAAEVPAAQEMNATWRAIQAADPFKIGSGVEPFYRRRVWRTVLGGCGIAAVLALSLVLGRWRYHEPAEYVSVMPPHHSKTALPDQQAASSSQVSEDKKASRPGAPRSLGYRYRRGRIADDASVDLESNKRASRGGATTILGDARAESAPTADWNEDGYGASRVPHGLEDVSTPGSASHGFQIPHPELELSKPRAQDSEIGTEDTGGQNLPSGLNPDQADYSAQGIKVIKTGRLTVEVDEYEQACERLDDVVTRFAGLIVDASSQEQTGGALVGRVVIRIAPERFEDLFAALKALGRLEAEEVKTNDVTAQYVDLEARIRSAQITEVRLRELIQNKSFVDRISSLLEIEQELGRVRSEIEGMQGELRVMADRVSLSTITVVLREPPRTVPSAAISVEVPILAIAAGTLESVLQQHVGRLLSGRTSKRDDGTLTGTYQLQVSVARFSAALRALEALGRVEHRQVRDYYSGLDSTAWAANVPCHIAAVLHEAPLRLPSGTIHAEVDALQAGLEMLQAHLDRCAGSIISNQTERQKDGSTIIQLKLQLPAGQFADLVNSLHGLGRITHQTLIGEIGNVIGGAANAPCQLSLTLAEPPREVPRGRMSVEISEFKTARQLLSTLIIEHKIQVLSSSSSQREDGTWAARFRLGIRTGDLDRVVSFLESLGRVQSRQISGLGLGDLSLVDPDALGLIELDIAEKRAITPAPGRAVGSIRDHFRDGLVAMYASLGLMVYGLVMMAPWAAIVAGVCWLVMRTLRRSRAGHSPTTTS